ncbi:LAQU0S07e01596g1_1 [Lachancea quebecensis]|uniref:LAQU0S07e01596g1_1 n=1 Tax=Lachancea quebecensis TaxID=1654605 RepID=A0A0P1KSB5_9SACH|nr:LAQU0S07e01596g1_1 [Lachancea quebecensis]
MSVATEKKPVYHTGEKAPEYISASEPQFQVGSACFAAYSPAQNQTVHETKRTAKNGKQPTRQSVPSLASLLRVSPSPLDIHVGNKGVSTPDTERTISRRSSFSNSTSRGQSEKEGSLNRPSGFLVEERAVDLRVPTSQCVGTQRPRLPAHGRKHSLDSLMTAAQTLESEVKNSMLSIESLDRAYQAKILGIIELKNAISKNLEDWPVTKDTLNIGHQQSCLIDSVSVRSIEEMLQSSKKLVTEVADLLAIKTRNTPHTEPVVPSNQSYTHQQQAPLVLPSPAEMLSCRQLAANNCPSGRASYSKPSKAATTSVGNREAWHQPNMPPFNQALCPENGAAYRGKECSTHDNGPTQLAANVASKIPQSVRDKEQHAFRIEKPERLKTQIFSLTKPPFDIPLDNCMPRDLPETMECIHCSRKDTPEWRRGPYGNRTVCNACGLFYGKLVRRFGVHRANIMMRYRRSTAPEDRRVPNTFFVPESFLKELHQDVTLEKNPVRTNLL